MISETYKELNRELHKTIEDYGISGVRYVDPARNFSDHGRRDILDYGCGKGTLKKALGPAYRVTNYDPCIEGLDTPPEPHDVVVCTDVMEHVEPEFVEAVLADIRRLTKHRAIFVISVVPAMKTLADGRNAHVSIYPIDWWKTKVTEAGFTIMSTHDDNGKFNTFGMICA